MASEIDPSEIDIPEGALPWLRSVYAAADPPYENPFPTNLGDLFGPEGLDDVVHDLFDEVDAAKTASRDGLAAVNGRLDAMLAAGAPPDPPG